MGSSDIHITHHDENIPTPKNETPDIDNNESVDIKYKQTPIIKPISKNKNKKITPILKSNNINNSNINEPEIDIVLNEQIIQPIQNESIDNQDVLDDIQYETGNSNSNENSVNPKSVTISTHL